MTEKNKEQMRTVFSELMVRVIITYTVHTVHEVNIIDQNSITTMIKVIPIKYAVRFGKALLFFSRLFMLSKRYESPKNLRLEFLQN